MSVMSRKGGTNAPPGSDTNLYITISCTYPMDNVLYQQTTENM